MKKHNFSVGDRVRLYDKGDKLTGTVTYYDPKSSYMNVALDPDSNGNCYVTSYCPEQCRKLKKREKSVSLTKRKLAAAWDETVYGHTPMQTDRSVTFVKFCKELGLE